MKYINFKSEYDRNPIIHINDRKTLFNNQMEIIRELKGKPAKVISFETYPGVDLAILKRDILDHLGASLIINIEAYAKSKEALNEMLSYNLTDDRVFGIMSHHTIHDFYEEDKLAALKKRIEASKGKVIVYGFGAHLVNFNLLVSVALTRWEIQLRYRKGMPNFKAENHNEDPLRKYKRGFFVEWRVADRIKLAIKNKLDYVIDYNHLDKPVMIDSKTYFESLHTLTQRPFRLVPYFDPGVWGGQWMKEVCNLPENGSNYAWSFDGVFEENSLKLKFNEDIIELPANDLVYYYPKELMGSRVHARFGLQYPIRFDLLDTFEGGNLSLQVHPLTEYMYDKFGMTFTQDESYYILDAKKDAICYLGFKKNVDQKAFEKDLRAAALGEKRFDADQYVHTLNVKKHDHLLIPAGTIHCSAKDTMVLEISASNYIFTFKLWDWDRLGLDGKPRPVHVDHGLQNLQFDRDVDFVENELVNVFERINENEEVTGLHEREFLKTMRYTFDQPYHITTDGTTRTANLVEGKAAFIESPTNAFEPYEVHYAETFILPAGINEYVVRPKYDNETCRIIVAQVR